MKKLKRHLYLFWSHHQWARRFIGGKWVKDKEPGHEWVMWGNMLSDHLAWPLNSAQYDMEDFDQKCDGESK